MRNGIICSVAMSEKKIDNGAVRGLTMGADPIVCLGKQTG